MTAILLALTIAASPMPQDRADAMFTAASARSQIAIRVRTGYYSKGAGRRPALWVEAMLGALRPCWSPKRPPLG